MAPERQVILALLLAFVVWIVGHPSGSSPVGVTKATSFGGKS